MYNIKTLKKNLVKKLINSAIFHGIGKGGGVGYHIKILNNKDKEIIKYLNKEDFNHRIK